MSAADKQMGSFCVLYLPIQLGFEKKTLYTQKRQLKKPTKNQGK